MILTLLGALTIGLSLGLLGSGGSILTVPVLVFLLHRPDKLAIAESLAIVGTIALAGSIPYGIKRMIDWKSVVFFGLTGMIGAYLGACVSIYFSGKTQLVIFAITMLIAAWKMLAKPSEEKLIRTIPISFTMLVGFLVGCLTGFIGIGGGFLIVPALVLLLHLSIHLAIGTSLMIIAINAFTGFVKQFVMIEKMGLHVDSSVIILVSLLGIIGSWIGSLIAGSVPKDYLRKGFGISLIILGIFILFNKL
ncbi:sulfite exporter TauE/SafE family protein [Candidatus Protochlamydia phocaeensis]|uniref:sulfite exporter TauE/SafE family protein n=1 Tax=Candidatus Protochlamydia phocaeensis TaxID=1414722 RepID=UPI00083981F7|nr:sulfite exporter TauE/SafE family protein [Candidatus Protochlamydia phocaeensis]